MRRPALVKQPPGSRQQIVESVSLPAPTGGWNARDSQAAMNPMDALRMENWFPSTADVRLRKGYENHVTGIGSQVESLMPYNEASGTQKLFAAAGTVFWDVTSSGTQERGVGDVGGVNLDGSTWLDGSPLTGISDGKDGTVSIFARFENSATTDENMLRSTSGKLEVMRMSTGAFRVRGKNAAGTVILDLTSTASYSAAGTYHILASWQMNSTGSRLLIDRVADLDSSTVTNDTIDYTVTEYAVGAADTTGSTAMTGDLYAVWFDTSFIDLTVTANINKFVDTNIRPIKMGDNGELPTSSSPILYLGENDFADWPTNRGTGTGAFDINGTLAQTTTPLYLSGSVQSNARWQHVNYMNSSGTSYLCCFNGVDDPRYYDGTDWISITATSTPAITGVTPSNLDNPWIHKRRLWTVEKNSLSAWYLPVDAVGGAASEFDLAGLFRQGGFLVAGGTWTIDAGEGIDDYCIFVSSEGEIAVYQGTDPSAASTWALQGIWRIGEPIGNRCLLKYAGDLLIICRDGVYPLSLALQSSQVSPQTAITDKIRGAMSEVAGNHGANFGWQLAFFPGGDMIILNVPTKEGSDQEQYVMNTITRSWGRFNGVEANCWGISNQEPYFGGDGFVGKFWSVFTDNDVAINGDLKQAFNYFGERAGVKHWTMVRPIFRATANPSIALGLNVDYGDDEPTGSLSFTPLSFAVWDTATWDSGVWGGGLVAVTNWQTVNEHGTCAALRMSMQAGGVDVRFQAADYVFERGGVI